ncbi:ABC transporter ATP-binding protein [Natronosporangium hydrolyticum]|nr:ABC transporter ATP-binding protein [Natronosporangium hydrolyticum]
MPHVEVRVTGVAKAYGGVAALHPLDVAIGDGEFVSLLGPSGCGKSTLLRCLAGLETPEQGRIAFGERVVFDAAAGIAVPARGRRLGMVFQDLALWPHLTVAENVAFPLRVRRRRDRGGRSATQAAQAALARVRLEPLAHRYPHQLSGGQQQRVAFARAVVAEPELLLMDEPLSALDAALRQELRAELAELTRSLALTTVYVTHDQEEAMSMSDRILLMSQGRLRQGSSPEVLYRSPADDFVARFVGRFNPLPDGGTPNGGLTAGTVRGVRPEHVRLAGQPGDIRVPARVAGYAYLGGRYELRCVLDDQSASSPWIAYHPAAPAPGSQLDLFVAPDDVIVTAA